MSKQITLMSNIGREDWEWAFSEVVKELNESKKALKESEKALAQMNDSYTELAIRVVDLESYKYEAERQKKINAMNLAAIVESKNEAKEERQTDKTTPEQAT